MLPAGLKGARDARYTMCRCSACGAPAAVGYLLGIELGMGVTGVWLGMFLDWTVRGISSGGDLQRQVAQPLSKNDRENRLARC